MKKSLIFGVTPLLATARRFETMKPTKSLLLLLALLLLPPLVSAQDNMGRVYDAVFEGDFVEKLWVFDHRWNFTSRVYLREHDDGTIEVRGRFRHYKRWNFDDRILFHFKLRHGTVLKSDIRIKKEGFVNYLLFPIPDILYEIFDDYSINAETIEEMIEQITLWSTDSWTQAAQKIVVLIVLEAYRPHMPLSGTFPPLSPGPLTPAPLSPWIE